MSIRALLRDVESRWLSHKPAASERATRPTLDYESVGAKRPRRRNRVLLVYLICGVVFLIFDVGSEWLEPVIRRQQLPRIPTSFQIANFVEAALWTAMGVGCAAASRKKAPANRNLFIAAITLLIFGASDVIEAFTGAWWRPWWLLVWKVLCVLVLVILVREYYIRTRHKTPS